MTDFDFYLPVKVLFGKDKEKQIGKELKSAGIKKVLFIYGKGSIKKSGLYDIVISALKNESIEFIEYSGVSSNPLLSHAYKGIEVSKENRVDAVLAVGGGSVIDEAKAIAAGAVTDDDVWDYYTGKEITEALPVFSIVTMAASCSYMNHIGVITHDEKKIKTSIKSKHVIPIISIINPEYFFSITDDYLAYSSVDTISHVLEPYFTQNTGSGLMDGVMESVIRSVISTTDRLLINKKDNDAWSENIWASSMAHSGLATTGVGGQNYPNHMFEHSLSAIYNIPHGAGLSIVIPAWMKWYREKNEPRLKKFAQSVFNLETASDAVNSLENWFKKINSPVRLSEVNINENELDTIKENVKVLAELWVNYTEYTEEVILDVLKRAL